MSKNLGHRTLMQPGDLVSAHHLQLPKKGNKEYLEDTINGETRKAIRGEYESTTHLGLEVKRVKEL